MGVCSGISRGIRPGQRNRERALGVDVGRGGDRERVGVELLACLGALAVLDLELQPARLARHLHRAVARAIARLELGAKERFDLLAFRVAEPRRASLLRIVLGEPVDAVGGLRRQLRVRLACEIGRVEDRGEGEVLVAELRTRKHAGGVERDQALTAARAGERVEDRELRAGGVRRRGGDVLVEERVEAMDGRAIARIAGGEIGEGEGVRGEEAGENWAREPLEEDAREGELRRGGRRVHRGMLRRSLGRGEEPKRGTGESRARLEIPGREGGAKWVTQIRGGPRWGGGVSTTGGGGSGGGEGASLGGEGASVADGAGSSRGEGAALGGGAATRAGGGAAGAAERAPGGQDGSSSAGGDGARGGCGVSGARGA